MTIEIREHTPGKDLKDFLRVPSIVYADDPNYVATLEFDLKHRLTPGKGEFFKRGDLALFTAWKDGKLAGRISAQIDHAHLAKYSDATGFFGFFDTIDDEEVGKALVAKAKEWLKARGMKRVRGPLSLTMWEDIGLLVEGFDTPNAVNMTHARPYQDRIAKAAGLEKAKDLFAWYFDVGNLPDRAVKAWDEVQKMPEVRLRSVDPSKMQSELMLIMDIFNDAWSDLWGYVAPTPEETAKAAQDLKLVLDRDLAFIAEVDGRAVGMCIAIPNVNEAIHDFDGKLNPINIGKFLYRMKWRGVKSARLFMLGIRSELRNVRKYGYLSHALYVEIARRAQRRGYTGGELSWTLEDNRPVNLGIKSMGARVYKTYRIYEDNV